MSIPAGGVPDATWAAVIECSDRVRANIAAGLPLTYGADPIGTCHRLRIVPGDTAMHVRFGYIENLSRGITRRMDGRERV